ncbi:MAG: hypothetical protein Q9227_007104 [Pyrenula ochraceoflavens]
MTRATRTVTLLVALATIYGLLLLPLLSPDPANPPSPIAAAVISVIPLKVIVEIVPVLPFWAIVSFGAYLLGRLGLGVLKFKNVDSAFQELMGQLENSRKELKGMGVGTD